MPNWNLMAQECLSHFLCAFDPNSSRRKSEAVFRQILRKNYKEEVIDDFLDARLGALQTALIDEFNERSKSGHPIRYLIVDSGAVGIYVQGNSARSQIKQTRFQDALHGLNPAEFEKLSAVILRKLGCYQVFFTPTSHDQGLDAFGYQNIVSGTPYGVIHHLVWLAQAKHYESTNVSTNDIRALIGAHGLLLAKAFSTVDKRYIDLVLRHFAPIAVALITTEEVPSTVRRLAENAGVFVYAASDLLHLLNFGPSVPSTSKLRKLLQVETKSITTLS